MELLQSLLSHLRYPLLPGPLLQATNRVTNLMMELRL